MFEAINALIPLELKGILKINCDIPRWYSTLMLTRNGVTKPLSHFVIDNVDIVTIMDY